MVQRRTNKGQVIDFEQLMAQNSPALGNMGVDADGSKLGPNGEIIEKREDRVRAYYKDHPQSSTSQASLKGLQPDQDPVAPSPIDEPKTAATAKENVRTSTPVTPDTTPEPTPPAGEEFDNEEPLGFKEKELPNGDIEMVPYYTEEEDEDKSV